MSVGRNCTDKGNGEDRTASGIWPEYLINRLPVMPFSIIMVSKEGQNDRKC